MRIIGPIILPLLAASAACAPDRIAEVDEVFYRWDGREVLCAATMEYEPFGNSLADITEGLERARDRGEVLLLYGHRPRGDGGLAVPDLEGILAAAADLGLRFFTVPDLLDPPPPGERAGIAVTFDDAHVEKWHAERELFASYGARVTFFVTRFDQLDEAELGMLRELAADGHAIESHGHRHRRATDYVLEHGVRAYVEDEVLPSLEAMRAAGFEPRSYAYPFGSRASDIDEAVLEHFEVLRSISFVTGNALISDPCP